MLRPGVPGTFDHEVAREADDERALRARLDVRHHQRVGRCPSTVGIGLRVAERRGVAGVVHEGAGVGADDQVVGAAGRCRREPWDDDALDVADAVGDAAVDERHCAAHARARDEHRDEQPTPEAAPTQALVGAFVGAAPRVGRRPRHSPRCSRSQTHAASGDSVVVVAPGAPVVAVLPSPWKSFPSTSTISVPDSWESGTSLAPGTMLWQQLRLGQVGRGVADLGVVDETAWVVLGSRRSRSPSAGAPGRCCRPRRCTPEPLRTKTRTSTGRTAGGAPAAVARSRRRGRCGGDRRLAPEDGQHRVGLGLLLEQERPRRVTHLPRAGSRRSDRCRRPRRGP